MANENIIGRFVDENREDINRVRKENPELYEAMAALLSYMANKYAGVSPDSLDLMAPTVPSAPEVKPLPQPSAPEVEPTAPKEGVVRLKEARILFNEGKYSADGTYKTLLGLQNAYKNIWDSWEASGSIGYNKSDLELEWEDGTTMKSRVDVGKNINGDFDPYMQKINEYYLINIPAGFSRDFWEKYDFWFPVNEVKQTFFIRNIIVTVNLPEYQQYSGVSVSNEGDFMLLMRAIWQEWTEVQPDAEIPILVNLELIFENEYTYHLTLKIGEPTSAQNVYNPWENSFSDMVKPIVALPEQVFEFRQKVSEEEETAPEPEPTPAPMPEPTPAPAPAPEPTPAPDGDLAELEETLASLKDTIDFLEDSDPDKAEIQAEIESLETKISNIKSWQGQA